MQTNEVTILCISVLSRDPHIHKSKRRSQSKVMSFGAKRLWGTSCGGGILPPCKGSYLNRVFFDPHRIPVTQTMLVPLVLMKLGRRLYRASIDHLEAQNFYRTIIFARTKYLFITCIGEARRDFWPDFQI